jgi:hypothetical protein
MISDEDRKRRLQDLLAFDGPIEDLAPALVGLPWDSEEELVNLTAADVASVLERYGSGTLSSEQVEAWANLIEGRDDIGVDPEGSERIAEAVHVLANPLLEGSLNERHSELMASLKA